MAKVRALTSFAGGGQSYGMGDVFELPPGVDWLRAGLVEKVGKAESAAMAPPAPKGGAPGAAPVTDVKGVAKATAAKLEAAGVSTVAQLAAVDAAEEVPGVSFGKLSAIVTAAREMLT